MSISCRRPFEFCTTLWTGDVLVADNLMVQVVHVVLAVVIASLAVEVVRVLCLVLFHCLLGLEAFEAVFISTLYFTACFDGLRRPRTGLDRARLAAVFSEMRMRTHRRRQGGANDAVISLPLQWSMHIRLKQCSKWLDS